MFVTQELLESRNPGELFSTGLCMVNGDVMRFVAVRGGALDWAVYYGSVDMTPDEIRSSGDKMFPTHPGFPVSASAAALDLYRY